MHNTFQAYLVCKIIDNKGNIADTPYGKLTLELLDENGSVVVYDEIPIQHGILIMRHDGETERVNVHYDGSYIYKPADFSRKIQIENTTTLSDENITGWH